MLSAKVVGRWPNGTPLVTHPDDFRYDSDLDSRRCPLGSPERRSNPRDALVFVETRGGEYLFVPGISALAAIANGTTG